MRQPLHNGELRGGAWVVVDPTINEARMEMYADEESRGGILEPPGICEVKFRDKDQKAAMHRLDPVLLELDQDPEDNQEDISSREAQLLPMYTQVAHEFADLHDRSGRMLAKGVIRDVVQWENAREYFHARLKRRLKTDELAMEAGADAAEVEERLEGVATKAGIDWSKDVAVTEWLEKNADTVGVEVSAVGREAAIADAVESLAGLDEGALEAVLAKLKANAAKYVHCFSAVCDGCCVLILRMAPCPIRLVSSLPLLAAFGGFACALQLCSSTLPGSHAPRCCSSNAKASSANRDRRCP